MIAMKRSFSLVAVMFLAVASVRATEDDVVRATGVASTYRAAVNEALVAALEQHDGISVSTVEIAKAGESSESTAGRVNGVLDERTKTSLNDSIAKDMLKWAKGKIKTYEVVSDTMENGKYRVEVAAHFAGKYTIGLPESNRRRLVVANFRPETGDSIRWMGQAESSAMWVSTLADKLNERLTQTRKFTMLDRKFDAEVTAELAKLSQANAAPADAVRANQRLSTDYLVTGSVKFFTVAPPAANPLTGQVMPSGSQPFCEVTYRVLLAPTGQLKWTDSVMLDAANFPASSIGIFAIATADAAAMQIADGIMSNLLPFEVVGKNGAGEIIIGEGGKSLAPGERFTVYALGEEVTDTRTGEVLDQLETPIGDVEIVRVAAKVSYARVLGGDAEKMVIGSRLRRAPMPSPAQTAPSAPPVQTTIQGTTGGGVVTPF